jgi:hypothetical protein
MLPELPKQNKHREADFGVSIKEKYDPLITSSIELKDTGEKDYLNFSEVTDAQIAYALAIQSSKGVWVRTLGLNGQPDYIFMRNEPARIAIKYPNGISVIEINDFLIERNISKRKSLTWERAKSIGSICSIEQA